ncbi:MAG: TetR/AcrR family transcriptional regulator [Paracoccaceae bacterium]
MMDVAAQIGAITADRQGSLGDACVAEALSIITQEGLSKLSLREVARRLGVSHQAPYRHFESRDHLVAEVLRRCFQKLADGIGARERSEDPKTDLHRMGAAYLRFAMENPLEYDLMFAQRWPEVGVAKQMIADSCLAFEELRITLARLRAKQDSRADKDGIDLDAMFIWSAMHGIASILKTDAMENLKIAETVRGDVALHIMARIDAALDAAV